MASDVFMMMASVLSHPDFIRDEVDEFMGIT